MTFNPIKRFLAVAAAFGASGSFVCAQLTGPIKVFLLAGQSNMQGHGFITEQVGGVETLGTLKHFVDNTPAYAFLRNGSNWVVRNDAWTWVRQGPVGSPQSDTYSTGNLTAGFGAGTNGGPTSWAIGPEFGLGMKVADYLTDQVAIVKICWGGSSLVGDWRPPSAVAKRGGTVGSYYNLFLSTWQQAKTALEARYPGRPIQVSGFGWHQGENDRFSAAATAEYEANLADLIVDLRAALSAPGMPVVIATSSDGPVPTPPSLWLDIENAQLAMSARENVTTISTRPLYRVAAVSPRDEAIHWNKNAESIYKTGEQMGQAMVTLLSTPDSPDATPPSPSPLGFSTPPAAINSTSVSMTATTATDTNDVQYRFVETSGNPGATSSDWQFSRNYTDTGLTPARTYSYTVQARDQSAAKNTTAAKAAVSVTTPPLDTTPPTPNPLTFATAPAAASAITINMTATTAVDANSPVEYYFEETTGNPGSTDSGWQSSPVFSDTGLKPSTTYSYRVRARDKEATPNQTAWSAVLSATTPAVPAGTIVWSQPTDISGATDVSTSGTLVSSYTGHNANGNVTVNGVTFVQGRIPNAQNSGPDIGSRLLSTGNATYDTFLRSISWNYTGGKVALSGLTAGNSYEIQIWAADNVESPPGMRSLVLSHGTIYAVSLVHEPVSGAPGQFTTGTFIASGTTQEFNLASYDYYGTPSQAASGAAITNGLQLRRIVVDTTPPTPNPATWATPPAASDSTSITMTATTASDASGVQYLFDETSGNPGGSDSAWQDSPSYTDAGLASGTSYTYTVRTRDKSPALNQTSAAAPASATTNTPPRVWNVNIGAQLTTSDNYLGAATENTTNSTWNSVVNPLPKTNLPLVDSTNATTPVTLDISAVKSGVPVTVIGTRVPTTGDEIFHSYVGGDQVTSTITIKGLTVGRTYDLVVYSDWHWSGAALGFPMTQTAGSGLTATVWLNRNVTHASGSIPALARDTNAANVSTGAGNVGNWYRIAGLAPNSTGQLGFRFADGNNEPLSGFQLIDTTPGGSAPLSPRPMSSFSTTGDYAAWAAIYAAANLSDPAADNDDDGLTNDEERSFGLNPTSGVSTNPISIPLNRTDGTFSYTRRNPTLTGLSYTVWTSTTLDGWTKDDGATHAAGTPDANGIQTVAVTLSPGLLGSPTLFVRVSASAPVD